MKKSKILHLSNVYTRYKCQLDAIPAEEIATYKWDIQAAFNKIPYTVDYLPIELNDFDLFVEGIERYRVLKVSTLHNESKFLTPDENLQFRAIHDYLHYVLNQPFTFEGEVNVYKAQKFLHTTDIGKKILYSEVVLQAAYCHVTGKFADVQKVIINY